MSYYERESEKATGLMPIVLGISLVTLIGFGIMYFTAGRALNNDGVTGESAPSAPAQPAPVPKTLPAHTHA